VVVGIDARNGVVETRGWTKPSGWKAEDLAAKMTRSRRDPDHLYRRDARRDDDRTQRPGGAGDGEIISREGDRFRAASAG
jgi:hypothetical protein